LLRFALIGFSILIFIIIMVMVFDDSSTKNRVYKDIYSHIPYKMDYSLKDGFRIIDENTNQIIQSNNNNIHKVMKDLQSKWIEENIKLEGNKVTIYKNKEIVKEYILINNNDIKDFREFWLESK
jgi:uncharacterized protein YbcV (DUF1398 family)